MLVIVAASVAASPLRLTGEGVQGRRARVRATPGQGGDFQDQLDLRKFLWIPKLGFRGLQRISMLRDDGAVRPPAWVAGPRLRQHALRAAPPFYADRQWGHITDWKDELSPRTTTRLGMLGVNEVPFDTPPDEVMHDLAERFDVADTYHRTPVGGSSASPGETVPTRTSA